MGRTSTFRYHIVYQAWNTYLRTIDIDYTSHYSCPKCKDQPDLIILDGIAMGTMKAVPDVATTYDQDQQYPMIPYSDRVFLPDTTMRKQLLKYCSEGLPENIFNELLKSLGQEMGNYISYSSNPLENWVTISGIYRNIEKVIKLLCHTDPISGIFQFSILEPNERKAIALLAHGNSVSESSLVPIYQKMDTLEIFLNSIRPTKDKTGLTTLHHTVSPLLQSILAQIDSLFSRTSRNLVEYSPESNNYFNYFPTFTVNYK